MPSLLVASFAATLAAPLIAAAPNDVWPAPQSFTQGAASAQLPPTFTISCSGSLCPAPLPAAFARYTNLLFFAGPAVPPSAGAITSLAVTVDADAPLALGVSENYTLLVPATGAATISAPTQWGALRALETFSQLVAWSTDAQGRNVYSVAGLPIAINDFPRFPWRGLLIDSSRHFLTLDALKTTLDAASYNKINRIHWHIVDDNSW